MQGNDKSFMKKCKSGGRKMRLKVSTTKGSKILLFVVGVGAVVLVFITLFFDLEVASLNVIAASLAVLASVFAAWSSLQSVELIQEQLNPNVIVYFDVYSRHNIIQLCMENIGGSPAYNIKFEWTEKALLDFTGKQVFFYKPGDQNGIIVLQPNEILYSKVDALHKVFENEDLIFPAQLTYTDGRGKSYQENILLSLEYFRGSLTYVKEESKAIHQLSKIDYQVAKITDAINKLTNEISKLG